LPTGLIVTQNSKMSNKKKNKKVAYKTESEEDGEKDDENDVVNVDRALISFIKDSKSLF
jgi:hypothetical protein